MEIKELKKEAKELREKIYLQNYSYVWDTILNMEVGESVSIPSSRFDFGPNHFERHILLYFNIKWHYDPLYNAVVIKKEECPTIEEINKRRKELFPCEPWKSELWKQEGGNYEQTWKDRIRLFWSRIKKKGGNNKARHRRRHSE